MRAVLLSSALLACVYRADAVAGDKPTGTFGSCDVVWTTPSNDSTGSMPIGNGDIGANVWVAQNGDLVFYLSKTDAWSENARLLKLGKVRVALTPNPFTGTTFTPLPTLFLPGIDNS